MLVWSDKKLKKSWFKILNLYLYNRYDLINIVSQKIDEEIDKKINNEKYLITKHYLVWKDKVIAKWIKQFDSRFDKNEVKEKINEKFEELYNLEFEIFYTEINSELKRVRKKNKTLFIKKFSIFYNKVLNDVDVINAHASHHKHWYLDLINVDYNTIVFRSKSRDLRIFESSLLFFFLILLLLFYIVRLDKILSPIFFLAIMYFYRILITEHVYNNIFYFFFFSLIYFEFGLSILYIFINFFFIFFLLVDNYINRLIVTFGFYKIMKTKPNVYVRYQWKRFLIFCFFWVKRKIYKKIILIFYFGSLFLVNVNVVLLVFHLF